MAGKWQTGVVHVAVEFRDLVAQAAKKCGVEWASLESEKLEVEARVRELEGELAELRRRPAELEGAFQKPLREAVKVAEVLGIAVPLEYQARGRRPAASGNGNGGRPSGSYLWEPEGKASFQGGIPGHVAAVEGLGRLGGSQR